ncbi:hypothetical protein LSH36_162g08000 [Paralvinella palmiformis]|uniref:Uncharacterized protein n=1 Tax=Paralvinella palmiformis TaxID=53620 RepID=A0AAD9JUI3_9ANNE|nr:hypothetical protein LSH36_162g08000 [Paralvinella palmiformis]
MSDGDQEVEIKLERGSRGEKTRYRALDHISNYILLV